VSPILLAPGAIVAVPKSDRVEDRGAFVLARIHAVQRGSGAARIVACLYAGGGLWLPSRRSYEQDEIRAVADVPGIAASVQFMRLSTGYCPMRGHELARKARSSALDWTLNGWPEFSAAHGLPIEDPPAPDGVDGLHIQAIVKGRGPYPAHDSEVKGYARIFRRAFLSLVNQQGGNQ